MFMLKNHNGEKKPLLRKSNFVGKIKKLINNIDRSIYCETVYSFVPLVLVDVYTCNLVTLSLFNVVPLHA